MSKPTSLPLFAEPARANGAPAPVAAALVALLRVYKLLLSPLFPGACRYLPTCSDYAAAAIRTHGARRGTWLALKRLSRCHPYGGSGLDPVPPTHGT